MLKGLIVGALALFASNAPAKIVKASEMKPLTVQTPAVAPAPTAAPTPAPTATVTKPASLPPSKVTEPAVKKSAARPHPRLDAKRIADWRAAYDEAKNLLVADQKYLIQYEDEDSTTGTTSLSVTFSKDDVEDFRRSVEAITEYRAELKKDCQGNSSHVFSLALDKYALALISFHRRALPIVGDISENNNVMVLLVNRTSLRDSTVLTSRYLQFKKQRFKDGMGRFLPADTQLVAAMVNVAKTLKVELGEDDWNRAYGLRESTLEMTSLWPRDSIFDATKALSEPREAACVVSADAMKGQATSHGSVIVKPGTPAPKN